MGARTIRMTQGDTRPRAVITLQDALGNPLDVSAPGDIVRFKLRALDAMAVKEVLICTKLAGRLGDDGVTVDTLPPYATAGRGGRVEVPWTFTSTDTVGEYEGEIEVTFQDGSVQTILERVPVSITAQL